MWQSPSTVLLLPQSRCTLQATSCDIAWPSLILENVLIFTQTDHTLKIYSIACFKAMKMALESLGDLFSSDASEEI